jgi:hypothetical protein
MKEIGNMAEQQVTKEEFMNMADALYDLQLHKGILDDEEKVIKKKLLTYMSMHQLKDYATELYQLQCKSNTTYEAPDPEEVRKILKEAAEEYIYEVVDPKLRLALPPQVAANLFTQNIGTTYIACVKKPTKV